MSSRSHTTILIIISVYYKNCETISGCLTHCTQRQSPMHLGINYEVVHVILILLLRYHSNLVCILFQFWYSSMIFHFNFLLLIIIVSTYIQWWKYSLKNSGLTTSKHATLKDNNYNYKKSYQFNDNLCMNDNTFPNFKWN